MKKLIPLILIAIIAQSCGSSTKLVSSWKDPEANAETVQLDKVLVAALSSSETNRRKAENYISERNPKIFPSYKIVNESLASNKDLLKQALENEGYDAILFLKLLDEKKSVDYVPGGYTSSYWSVYGSYWGAYYDPGYYTETTSYVIETSLYSLEDDKLLWSGVTSTFEPASIEQAMSEISDVVYKQMVKDGLLKAEED